MNQEKIYLVKDAKDKVIDEQISKAMKDLKDLNNKDKDKQLKGQVKDSEKDFEKKKIKAVNSLFKENKFDYNPINKITVILFLKKNRKLILNLKN